MTEGLLASVSLTLLVSGLVGAVAARLGLPGGALLWAIAGAAALHLLWADLSPLPASLRVAAQILIGITIGASVSPAPLRALHAVRWQVALSMAVLLAAATAAGLLLAARTPLDVSTALLATSPGGASDMAVVAVHFQLDAALVAGLQVIRQLLVFGLVPLLFALVPPPREPMGPGSPAD